MTIFDVFILAQLVLSGAILVALVLTKDQFAEAVEAKRIRDKEK